MEESNSFDCMVMDDDDDTDEPISLNDLRLMFAKLQEIHAKDGIREVELKKKLAEVKSASIEKKVSRLRNEVKELKDQIESIKEENKILSEFNLDDLVESQEELSEQLTTPLDIMFNDLIRCMMKTGDISELDDKPTITTHCQTDLTFPPSFTSLTSFTTSTSPSPSPSLPSCSASLEKERPFNAQDAFIEIQLARKRQLEDQLRQLKKQMWFEGPEVMLVKLDAYEKMLTKSSIRRRRKVQRNQNQFDCFLEISDNLEKRPRLETSRPPSPSSTNNNSNGNIAKMDEVVQLFFTAPPKQTNGQGSQNHT